MPINDEQEEDDLWNEFKKTKSPAIRDKFIRQYMPLVKYVAGKVAVGLPSSVEFDDLVGFGQFGLLDAINKYDTSKNVKFKTYAVTRIRGAIFDELRQIDWVPRSVRQKSREIEDAIVTFGSVIDDRIQGEIQITVIATGFEMRTPELMQKKEAVKSLSAADFFSGSFNTGSATLNPNPVQSGLAPQPKPAISPQKSQSDLMSIIDIPPFLQK